MNKVPAISILQALSIELSYPVLKRIAGNDSENDTNASRRIVAALHIITIRRIFA